MELRGASDSADERYVLKDGTEPNIHLSAASTPGAKVLWRLKRHFPLLATLLGRSTARTGTPEAPPRDQRTAARHLAGLRVHAANRVRGGPPGRPVRRGGRPRGTHVCNKREKTLAPHRANLGE